MEHWNIAKRKNKRPSDVDNDCGSKKARRDGQSHWVEDHGEPLKVYLSAVRTAPGRVLPPPLQDNP